MCRYYMGKNIRSPGEANKIDVLSKLTSTLLFKDIPVRIIDMLLKNRGINIVSFKEGEILLSQGELSCDNFFLLLSGGVDIIVNKKVIKKISNITVLGEIGFMNQSASRNATVQINTHSYFIEFSSHFLHQIPEKYQKLFYRNLMLEMSKKLTDTNYHIVTHSILDATSLQLEEIL